RRGLLQHARQARHERVAVGLGAPGHVGRASVPAEGVEADGDGGADGRAGERALAFGRLGGGLAGHEAEAPNEVEEARLVEDEVGQRAGIGDAGTEVLAEGDGLEIAEGARPVLVGADGLEERTADGVGVEQARRRTRRARLEEDHEAVEEAEGGSGPEARPHHTALDLDRQRTVGPRFMDDALAHGLHAHPERGAHADGLDDLAAGPLLALAFEHVRGRPSGFADGRHHERLGMLRTHRQGGPENGEEREQTAHTARRARTVPQDNDGGLAPPHAGGYRPSMPADLPSLRPATEADLPALAALYDAAVRALGAAAYSPAQVDA